MATSPTTAPVAAPSTDGLRLIQPSIIQVKAADAAAVLVATKAFEAKPPEVRALPALKPNQPNHRRAAPNTTIGILLGSIGSLSWYPLRGPSTMASANADTPALMCTTVPPAKSRAPNFASHPPLPHTQWATGQYTKVSHRAAKTRKALNLIRST